MKKRIDVVYCLLIIGVLLGCNPGTDNTLTDFTIKPVAGDRYSGGIFRMNESEYFKNLFPHNITDAYSYRIASQIYEGLLKFDITNLTVKPSLAESYEIDETGTVYTFRLKKNVFFHDDDCFPQAKGRLFTAEDVAYCFTRLCTPGMNNQGFSVFKDILKGASEYYQDFENGVQNEKGVNGIEVVDQHTIRLTLTQPNSIFLVNLARPFCFIYPKEAEKMYGVDMRVKAVGTGPFYLSDIEEDISIILKKNTNYHRSDTFGNKLPLLDALDIHFIKDKKSELFEFKNGNLDMVYRLPTEHLIEILEESARNDGQVSDFQLQRVPEMVTQFLCFNTQKELFKDINIRKAFNFAIDREKILDFVLNGEGFAAGHHGIVPPVFSFYPIDDVSGYRQNLDSARFYLAEAGYPDGNGFPRLEFLLNPEGQRNTLVAVEIQKQLADFLNVEVELSILPFAQLMERSMKGDFDLLRIAWIADFPSPENFLWLFEGSEVPDDVNSVSYPNIARYRNAEFDRLYQSALHAKSPEDGNLIFKQAEKLLMKDLPFVILWYDEGYRIIKSNIENFPNNPMQYRDFSEVYFKPI
jgi:peptide/nickel transport system substrate-binding protein